MKSKVRGYSIKFKVRRGESIKSKGCWKKKSHWCHGLVVNIRLWDQMDLGSSLDFTRWMLSP